MEQMKAQFGPVLEGLVLEYRKSVPPPLPGELPAQPPKVSSGEEFKGQASAEDDPEPVHAGSLYSDFLLQQLLAIPTNADDYIEKDVPR